jgi:hypothetical protein
MPTEPEMLPRDKYTMFDRKEKRYRKGIHSESYYLLSLSGMNDGEVEGELGGGDWSDDGPRGVFIWFGEDCY